MGTTTGQFITALTAEHDVIVIGGLKQLPAADPATARGLLDRFVDWRTCQAALQNPNPEVREMALKHLHEFAADGDPFSRALLEEREIP